MGKKQRRTHRGTNGVRRPHGNWEMQWRRTGATPWLAGVRSHGAHQVLKEMPRRGKKKKHAQAAPALRASSFGSVGNVHNQARELAYNLMHQKAHIETIMIKQTDDARMAYRTCLNASLKCTRYLLRQGFSFRGHDENATSRNKGNYLELLQFLAGHDEKVKAVVLENAPGNLKLIDQSIQKYIVNACAKECISLIMSDLKDRYFPIIVDEARDISIKEHMAIVVCYVNNKGQIIERFVGVQHVIDTSSSTLKKAIDEFFSFEGLSFSKLRGQGYDRASNMRGEFNGLKTNILREQPCAFYVHCFAHQLQLALVVVAKKNIGVASFFTMANGLVNVVGASCKRRDALIAQYQEELVKAFDKGCLIMGRGLNQDTTLISIICMFPSVVNVLQMIVDDNPNDSSGEAFKLLREIQSFKFVFYLFFYEGYIGNNKYFVSSIVKERLRHCEYNGFSSNMQGKPTNDEA